MIFEQDSLIFQIQDVLYIEQGSVSLYNYNRNFDALSFRIDADTILEYNDKVIEASKGSLCYFPTNTNYKRISKKDKMFVIHFKTFNYSSDEIECFTPEKPEQYSILFEELYKCWTKKEVSYKHEASSIFCRILSEAYKENNPGLKTTSKLLPAISYIKDNCYKNDFSLTVAASLAMVSEPYFRKLFKKEYGVSPKQYVIQRRIKYAESMIMAGYYSLTEISEMCGYNDYKHFSVEFKKATGLSPSKYKYNFQEGISTIPG